MLSGILTSDILMSWVNLATAKQRHLWHILISEVTSTVTYIIYKKKYLYQFSPTLFNLFRVPPSVLNLCFTYCHHNGSFQQSSVSESVHSWPLASSSNSVINDRDPVLGSPTIALTLASPKKLIRAPGWSSRFT